MFARSRFPSAAAYLAFLLSSLAGCQTADKTADKLGLQKPPRQSPLAEFSELPSEAISAEQKADVQMAIAQSLERQGARDQAINAYREVVRNDDSRADALHRLAVLYDGKGDFETSWQFYRTALSQDPNNAELLCDWGYRCYLHRDFQQAEAFLRKAISLKDGFARAHNNLGLLLGRAGRCDEALYEFAKAGCSEADARSNLAIALSLEGRSEAAREQFELAVRGGSTSDAARVGLRALGAAGSQTRSVMRASAPNTPFPPLQSPPVVAAGGPRPNPPGPIQSLPPDWGAPGPSMYPVASGVSQWNQARR
ncbi:MAG: tetratricopeptide repeat protein [Planctomycetota bacterium]|jgi:Flp pilus assembly protein TadD